MQGPDYTFSKDKIESKGEEVAPATLLKIMKQM